MFIKGLIYILYGDYEGIIQVQSWETLPLDGSRQTLTTQLDVCFVPLKKETNKK